MVFLDANENLSKGSLQRMFTSLNMYDEIEQRVSLLEPNKKIMPPASWFRGRFQIDGIFFSENTL